MSMCAEVLLAVTGPLTGWTQLDSLPIEQSAQHGCPRRAGEGNVTSMKRRLHLCHSHSQSPTVSWLMMLPFPPGQAQVLPLTPGHFCTLSFSLFLFSLGVFGRMDEVCSVQLVPFCK